MKKAICAIVALAMVFILGSCSMPSFTGLSVEELLRAPQPSPEQNAVQKALNTYLGETMQLKYPRSGAEMTPFIIHDFDGDKISEAAVLYVTGAKGVNVHIAMLEYEQDTWKVSCEIEGLSTEVDKVELAQLELNAPPALVVSYTGANLTDKYLAAYSYKSDTLTPLVTQAYSKILLQDIDNDKAQEILLVTTGVPTLMVYKIVDGQMLLIQSTPVDERIDSCVSICADTQGAITIDGILSNGAVSTQLFTYENGHLTDTTHAKEDGPEIFALSRRYVQGIVSFDIDNNGSVDIPSVSSGVNTLNTTRRFYYVTWNDFSRVEYMGYFGVYDARYGYFVRLPSEWKDTFAIMDDGSADGGWNLRTLEGSRLIASVRITPRSTAGSAYSQVAILGDKKLMMTFSESCSPKEVSTIISGITVF